MGRLPAPQYSPAYLQESRQPSTFYVAYCASPSSWYSSPALVLFTLLNMMMTTGNRAVVRTGATIEPAASSWTALRH